MTEPLVANPEGSSLKGAVGLGMERAAWLPLFSSNNF